MNQIPITIMQSGGTDISVSGAPTVNPFRGFAPREQSKEPVMLPVPLAPNAVQQNTGAIVNVMFGPMAVPGMTASFVPLSASPAGGFAAAPPAPATAPSPAPGRWPVSTER